MASPRTLSALVDIRKDLGRAHGTIETVFLGLGQSLERGMTVLGDLTPRVGSLPAEIDGAAMRAAEEQLGTVAATLRAVEARLPAESEALAALAQANQAVARRVRTLVDSIRTIVILARTSRIQAAALQAAGAGFSLFADEIVRLATSAQAIVGRFQQDHDRLAATIAAAVEAHRAFVTGHAGQLARIAADLAAAGEELGGRRRHALDLSDRVSRSAEAMSAATGEAVMSLQVGDSTRQRLEHVCEGLERALDVQHIDGDPDDVAAAASLVIQVEADQLEHALDAMRADTITVRDALSSLAEAAADLADASGGLSAGTGDSRSFLDILAGRLARAQALTAACDTARAPVEIAVLSVTDTLGRLRNQMGELEAVVASITLVGINAAVRSARFGTDGQALAVIAQDLRLYADCIVGEAAGLVDDFAQVSAEAESLQGGESGRTTTTRGLDGRLAEVLACVRDGNARLTATLEEIDRLAARAQVILDEASAKTGMIADVEQEGRLAHGRLHGLAADLSPREPGQRARALAAEMFGEARHTMAAERDILRARLAG